MDKVVLVRYGEIGLKGDNRKFFEEALVTNIRHRLRHFAGLKIRRERGRIFVDLASASPGASGSEISELDASVIGDQLSSVPGIVSTSPAARVPADFPEILQAAEQLFSVEPPGTFKVNTRRADKRFPLTSMEINGRVGAHLLARFPSHRVDVIDPDLTLHIEVRTDGVYIFTKVVPGPGGLPVGVSNRGLLLLSGGLDSPVAGWMAMRRGMRLEAIHFYSYPFTTERSKQKVIDLCKVLARTAGSVPLTIIHFTEIQKAIRSSCPEALGVTIMRRMMFRIAERLATNDRIPALLTGESLSQVASQTVESLAVIEHVTRMPILRPLIAVDKDQITEAARSIGTYDLSILPYEDCCTVFVPKHPETKPRLDRVERAEEALDVERLVTEAVGAAERHVIVPD